jgi:hypothetical protein
VRVLGDKPNVFSLLRLKGTAVEKLETFHEKLETFYLLHCCPIDVDRGVLPLLFLKSTIISFFC